MRERRPGLVVESLHNVMDGVPETFQLAGAWRQLTRRFPRPPTTPCAQRRFSLDNSRFTS